jgi:hypothetical protein
MVARDQDIGGGDASGRPLPRLQIETARHVGEMHARDQLVAPPAHSYGALMSRHARAQPVNHAFASHSPFPRKELKAALITSTFGRHLPKILGIEQISAFRKHSNEAAIFLLMLAAFLNHLPGDRARTCEPVSGFMDPYAMPRLLVSPILRAYLAEEGVP